jgi:hypothetical protein
VYFCSSTVAGPLEVVWQNYRNVLNEGWALRVPTKSASNEFCAMREFDLNKLLSEYTGQMETLYPQPPGPAVNLNADQLEELLLRYRNFRVEYPDLSFWLLFDVPNSELVESGGSKEVFGEEIKSLKGFLSRMHPDYVIPYTAWGQAGYKMALQHKETLEPLRSSYRVSIPLRSNNGEYHWYSQHVTLTQLDADGNILAHLNTYYREGRWSPHNLRPFEACLNRNLRPEDVSLESNLYAQMTHYLLDAFTNKELEILNYHIADKTVDEIVATGQVSKHTLHEYNAKILKKAKNLFQYDFRTAKDFAVYCKERGFILALPPK